MIGTKVLIWRISGGSAGTRLFTLQNTRFQGVLTAPQQQLTAAMKQYWTDLAKTGSPDSLAGPWWPRFAATSQQLLSLVPPRPQVETGFAAEHHCAFWALAS